MTNEEILALADKVFPEAVRLRRLIHEKPEIGNKEFETTKLITETLENAGIAVSHPLETGAVGFLSSGINGMTVALRADIDALPVNEETGLPFSSKVGGMMHACGHDIHTAALLGTAIALNQIKDKFCGDVKFIFQPDEEGDGGAQRMIESGAFKNPDVSAVFGFHIRPETESGKVAFKFGKSYAASDVFKVTIKGKSSHGAEPEKGINALTCAAQIITRLGSLIKETVPENEKAVLSICEMKSGTAVNIIPDEAVFEGIIRTLGKDTRSAVKERFREVINDTAKKHGCLADIYIRESYPGVVNDDEMTAFAKENAISLFGEEMAETLTEPTMTTEDFGYYLDESKGCFYHIGVGCDYPLHSPKLIASEESIRTAIALNIKLITEYLR